MIQEAIILAGGFGTRLREAVPELPKCLAPVAGKPFIFYVINYLRLQGGTHFIFSLGYKSEYIIRYLEKEFTTLHYTIVIEEEPLGTGGAIQLALSKTTTDHVLVTNGDTLFKINTAALEAIHQSTQAVCTLALKPMENFDRYGVVQLNEKNIVTSFKEKAFYASGTINGGTYLINKPAFLAHQFPDKFSFEKDFLEPQVSNGVLFGVVQDGYFIDIGIPADFEQAQKDFAKAPINLANITKEWTLFLDRDGVLNEEKENSYVFNPEELKVYDYTPECIASFNQRFGKVVIVTNQRGVGKGLMTLEELNIVHQSLQENIKAAGGYIDAIYFETAIDSQHPNRKPNTGMALQAKQAFAEIDFTKSIMVGNNISDMQFGHNAGMYTVLLQTTNKTVALPHPYIDMIVPDLEAFKALLPQH